MIKGVNKLIIEIANPESEFFERAIFFVKPQMKDTSQRELNNSANDFIFHTHDNSRTAPRKKSPEKIPSALKLAGAAGVGAAVAAIVIGFL